MILPYGPVPLTAGIVTSQDVDSSAAWVVVENVSLFLYLGVSFWPSKPPAVTVFNGQPWNVVIQPGGTLRVPTPAQGWLGRIWLLGVDASGQSAATGTVSSYSSALLRTYGPDDMPSDSPSVVRGLDILSQPRIIHIPMTPAASYSWGATLVNAGNDYGPFPATVATLNPATDTGCVVYFYSVHITPGTVVGAMLFSIRLVVRDYTNPGIILANLDYIVGHIGLSAAATGEQFAYHPATPFSVALIRGGILPANAGIIEVTLHDAASPANYEFYANVQIDSDKLSPGQLRVPGIGSGLNPSQYSAGVPKF